MYYMPYVYPYPHYVHVPGYNYGTQPVYPTVPLHDSRSFNGTGGKTATDYGPNPFVTNINEATKQNNMYRTALWTGEYLQLTLMSIAVGGDIGLEMHADVDQFLRVEQGQGMVKMGNSKDNLTFTRHVSDDSAIFIPAGTWHNLINTGNVPLKLYSIYAPPNHPSGTVHATKAEAMAAEEAHGHGRGYTYKGNM